MHQLFLLTRFNVKHKEWQFTKHGEDVLSEKWLKNRFSLFETYCLPSIVNQVNKNFTWLVFFDNDTPQFYKEKIKHLCKKHKQLNAVFVDSKIAFLKSVKDEIKKRLLTNTTYLVTTRLDNDDALHTSFFNTIHQNIDSSKHYVIDSRLGFQCVLTSKSIRKMTVKYNPFITLVEPVGHFKTVLSKKHHEWHTHETVIINNSPQWIQVIHQENITNAEKLQYKETNAFKFEDFGLKPTFKLKSNVKIFISNVLSFLKRIWYKLK